MKVVPSGKQKIVTERIGLSPLAAALATGKPKLVRFGQIAAKKPPEAFKHRAAHSQPDGGV
jgi:hypothetical protein